MLFMPMMRTKAPSGSARTPYSVSPLRKLHSRGPNPMKNCVAFIPVQRAVMKCPSSCRKIEISTPTTNTNHQMLNSAEHADEGGNADHADQTAYASDEVVITLLGDRPARHDLAREATRAARSGASGTGGGGSC